VPMFFLGFAFESSAPKLSDALCVFSNVIDVSVYNDNDLDLGQSERKILKS
jgi:hypothetical protein